MANLSENYYLRKYYLATNEVPTQKMVKAHMTPLLADIYFKDITSNLRVHMPVMKGSGMIWYAPPKKLLEGRLVLCPEKKSRVAEYNYIGVDKVGIKLNEKELKLRQHETKYQLGLSDYKWNQYFEHILPLLEGQYSHILKKITTNNISTALTQFEKIYKSSITSFESLMSGVAAQAVQAQQDNLHKQILNKLKYLVKQQSLQLKNLFDKRLEEEKNRLKTKFMHDLEVSQAEVAENIHDIKVAKQLVLDALGQYNESQKLACQVYVALKERGECQKQIELSKDKYRRKLKLLNEEIAFQNVKFDIYKEQEKKRQELGMIWTKKVKRFIKKFELFITYCLQEVPEQAQFFMDLEKLTLLQLNEVIENPGAGSLFVSEHEAGEDHIYPTPLPNPYYLLCDRERNKLPIDLNMCPKKLSSSTEFPVVVINKRCTYSACDNFKQLSDKLAQFIHQRGEDELHLEDHYNYEHAVPVKYTASQQLSELKLQSSLLQIIQQEKIDPHQMQCPICNMPNCLCGILSRSDSSTKLSSRPSKIQKDHPKDPLPYINVTHCKELNHEREPKLVSYLTLTCDCRKTFKKGMMENLPPYMRQISAYSAPGLPNYEMCSIQTLRQLVKKSRNITEPSPIESQLPVNDAQTQCADVAFDKLCNCFTFEQETVAEADEWDIGRNIVTSLLEFE